MILNKIGKRRIEQTQPSQHITPNLQPRSACIFVASFLLRQDTKFDKMGLARNIDRRSYAVPQIYKMFQLSITLDGWKFASKARLFRLLF